MNIVNGFLIKIIHIVMLVKKVISNCFGIGKRYTLFRGGVIPIGTVVVNDNGVVVNCVIGTNISSTMYAFKPMFRNGEIISYSIYDL